MKRFFNPSFKKLAVFLLALLLCSSALAAGSEPQLLATEVASEFAYDYPEADRSNVFAGHSVLVLIPHQDDEACLMGGILEEYVRYGSTVSVAFTTNGDFYSTQDTSMRAVESLSALATCGVKAENVYFFGYGDQWLNGHIYNADGDKKMTSHVGEKKTYGSDANHTIYHEGVDYTRNNLKADIRSLILEIKPDTIFCIDFDGHQDHRCLSLLFEEMMGELLKEQNDYKPFVFKGFGYSLAWHGLKDFYQENIFSSKKKSETDYMQENGYYTWANRVRFPVSKSTLSRLKSSSSLYKMLTCYSSQKAAGQAAGIINGDRCFWYRDTSSLLYAAEINVSSGNGALLTDFRIIDSENVKKVDQGFTNHVWAPSSTDTQKAATVTFSEPTDITELRFYDNPDISANVLNLSVTFSDGSSLDTGALQPNGAATSVSFERKSGITGFTVAVTDSEGKDAGLCEMEAYNSVRDNGVRLIKLINESDDFVYDYWIDEKGEETFSVYAYPFTESGDLEALYTLDYENKDGCSAYIEGDRIRIVCASGNSFEVTLRSKADPTIYDSVKISNPSHARRLLMKLVQHLEHASGI